MRRLAAAVLSIVVGLAPPAGAAPGDDIGSTIKVVNQITAAYEQENRTLATGDGVRQQELIGVGADSLGELKFVDDTKLALGPGAKILLDKFVFDPEKAAGSIVVNLVKGSFRFITGIAAKPAYVIKTPSAAITVRGTIFDVYVMDNGMTWLLLHEGGVKICNTRGKCRDLDEPGKLIRVTEEGDVGVPVRWAGLPGADAVPFDTAFPFVGAPPSFDASPVFTRDALLGDDPAAAPQGPEDKPDPRKAPSRGKKAAADEPDVKPAGGKAKPKDNKTKVTTAKPKKPKGGRVKYADDNVQIKTGIDIVIGSGAVRFGGGGGKPRGGHSTGDGKSYPGKMRLGAPTSSATAGSGKKMPATSSMKPSPGVKVPAASSMKPGPGTNTR